MYLKTIIICGIILFVALIGVGVFFLLGNSSAPTNSGSNAPVGGSSQQGSNYSNTNTSSNTGGTGQSTVIVTPTQPTTGTSTSQTSRTLAISTNDGASVMVHDFKSDPNTILHPSLSGHYYLAGGIDPVPTTPFRTFYLDSDQSFRVTLFEEPLGQTRLAAENDLMQRLGIQASEMCRLKYIVSVPEWVNEIYSNKGNLGWSFCPTGTALP
ncbi:hypothetical protein H7X87_02800 [Acetobacteraceae bacterium]|nr:hypothetical protein [Candidatus Parcubacteria bacterium]